MRYAKEAARFDNVKVDPVTRRKLYLLKQALVLPAPSRPGAAQELADIAGTARHRLFHRQVRLQGQDASPSTTWRTSCAPSATRRDRGAVGRLAPGVSPQMKADYARLVDLANEGARELGYADTGALWRSGYDMPPDAFAAMTDRLWDQVEPLLQQAALLRARAS